MPHARASLRVGILTVGLAMGLAACSDNGTSVTALPPDVQSVIFLQRSPRNSNGNVFDYTSFVPGARLVKLEPPSADGKLTVLTADPMWSGADIMAWDLSFDAKSVVFSARLADSNRFQLFSMNVDGTNPKQLTEGDFDYVYPMFLPGQKIMFMTSKNVEEGGRRSSRTSTSGRPRPRSASMNLDGSGESWARATCPTASSRRSCPTATCCTPNGGTWAT